MFRPEGTRYLNDHTLVRGTDRRWHLYGITHHSMGMPHAERSLLHATAADLGGPWREEADVIMAMGDELVLWAPFVLPVEPGRWVMYFWGGTPDNRTQRADSDDLVRWTRDPRSVPGGRDPFVLRVGGSYHFYSVGVSAESRGQILVTTSADLERWSAPAVAIEDPVPGFGWGNLESPTVVARDDGYYLFVTRTSDAPIGLRAHRGVPLRGPHPLRLGAGDRDAHARRRSRGVRRPELHHLRWVDVARGRAVARPLHREARLGAAPGRVTVPIHPPPRGSALPPTYPATSARSRPPCFAR